MNRRILERYGFNVTKGIDGYNLQQHTPAGEDWNIPLKLLKDIKDYAENFDAGEEFAMWVEAKNNGFEGVPEYEELWADQVWKQNLLNKIANLKG